MRRGRRRARSDSIAVRDVAGGASSQVLQAGDLVVAVTAPLAFSTALDPASPPARTCGLLAARCQARVANLDGDKLNTRSAPSKQGEVVRQFAEGDVIRLSAGYSLGDGFPWWPVGSQTATSEYVAQGDPQAPDRPWLVPAGQPC